MAYEKELAFAKDLAKVAGGMIRDNFGLETEATWKSDHTPLTTTDIAINQLVIERVQATFAGDGVLGEEASYEAGRGRLWVVDPIDGTMPFTLGAPLSTFLLSLVVDGQPVLGIIYDPYLDRMFWAAKGHGTFLNKKQLHVSDEDTLTNNFLILSTRMGDGHKSVGELFNVLEDIKCKAFNFRSFGYGSAFVAAGRAVGAILGVPNTWDAVATKIIVEEAGGKVTDINGNERRYDGPGDGLLASNGKLHGKLLELLHV